MTEKEIEASNRHYAGNLARNQDAACVCDWGSPASQGVRFRILASIAPLEGRSVLDVGCGLGGLANWFEDHGIDVDYTGYDLSPEIVAEARRRNPGRSFEARDILRDPRGRRFDYVLSSGIFNRVYEDNPGFIDAMLRAFYAISARGVGANFITTWADTGAIASETFQVDPNWLLATARKITRNLAFRHDYMPHDATLFLYREDAN